MAMCLSIQPLKTRSALEPAQKCEPSTYQHYEQARNHNDNLLYCTVTETKILFHSFINMPARARVCVCVCVCVNGRKDGTYACIYVRMFVCVFIRACVCVCLYA